MNKSLLAIIVIVAIAGIGGAYSIMPYFTNSTVDEALPAGAISQSKMEYKAAMEEKAMMEKEMMEKEAMEKEMSTTSYEGTFTGVGDGIHDAQGDAYTIPLENGNNVLRLENFESTNGPDLYVYLATDDRATDFVNLGILKANNGNQNYDIPADTDLTKYNNVLIWCKSFGVLFGSADLSS